MSSDPPQAGIAGGVNVLFTPGEPGAALGAESLNPFAYWVVTAVMLSGLSAVTVWVWSLCLGIRARLTLTRADSLGLRQLTKCAPRPLRGLWYSGPERYGHRSNTRHQQISGTYLGNLGAKTCGRALKIQSCSSGHPAQGKGYMW